MGILNNYKISELKDEELEIDLDRTNMVVDKKALVISELIRRRIKETKEAITDLKQSIDNFSLSSENYSRKIVFLTTALVILTLVLAIPLLIDFMKLINSEWTCFLK